MNSHSRPARLMLVLLWLALVMAGAGAAPFSFPRTASWTVKLRYADFDPDKAEGDVRPLSVNVMATGGVRRYVISWSDKRSSEVWQTAQGTFQERTDSGAVDILPRGVIPDLSTPVDEALFTWITPQLVPTESDFRGRKALLFSKGAEEKLDEAASPSLAIQALNNRQAWIDAETSLPLAYSNQQVTCEFTFHEPPPAPLELPARFQRALDELLANATQLPPWARGQK